LTEGDNETICFIIAFRFFMCELFSLESENRFDSVFDYKVYDIVTARKKAVNLIRRKNIMALQKGEIYRCPDANCGCEITVTKGAREGCKGQEQPRCCCGKTMEKA